MAYRLKDYLYNDKLTKEQNILMDRLYKLRMSGMAEAFEKQLLEPNTGLEPFEVRFAAIVNQEWDQRESKKFKRLMKKATLVSYFKRTGKRVFRMAPIHHHFEMGGMKETKVVSMLWGIGFICALIGLLLGVM